MMQGCCTWTPKRNIDLLVRWGGNDLPRNSDTVTRSTVTIKFLVSQSNLLFLGGRSSGDRQDISSAVHTALSLHSQNFGRFNQERVMSAAPKAAGVFPKPRKETCVWMARHWHAPPSSYPQMVIPFYLLLLLFVVVQNRRYVTAYHYCDLGTYPFLVILFLWRLNYLYSHANFVCVIYAGHKSFDRLKYLIVVDFQTYNL